MNKTSSFGGGFVHVCALIGVFTDSFLVTQPEYNQVLFWLSAPKSPMRTVFQKVLTTRKRYCILGWASRTDPCGCYSTQLMPRAAQSKISKTTRLAMRFCWETASTDESPSGESGFSSWCQKISDEAWEPRTKLQAKAFWVMGYEPPCFT